MGRWTRRAFLKASAAGLVSATMLRGLERPARAASDGAAQRLVVFFSPNGTIHPYWRPTGEGASFDFPAGSILEPLAAHKDGLLILDGIDFVGTANHEPGMRAMLTGNGGAGDVGGGASVDQFVAAQIGQGGPFRSLELGVHTSAWGASTQTRMCYAGPGVFVPPDDDPASVYARLAGKLVPTASGPSPDDLRRKKVLDLVAGEVGALRQQVGGPERAKLDEHLGALEQLQQSLSQSGLCGAIDPVPALDPQANDSFPAVTTAQIDLLVTALACGMTRVASLQCSHTVGPPVFTWLGLSEGHHSLSHKGDGDVTGMLQYVQAERWFAEQFASLLDKLAATPDAEHGGSLLDNTLVVWAQEMGDGRMHDCLSVPFVLAGAPGVLDSGRYLAFGGVPHQKLLVSICQIMGLTNTTFGDATHGAGPLAGLTR